MFAVIRRYNINAHSAEKIMQRVRDGFVPIVSGLPGFVSYDVVRASDETLVTFSVFESRQSADESSHLASNWVHDNLSSLIRNAPVIMSGEVVLHHSGHASLAPRTRPTSDRPGESHARLS